ncbi:MAG TPA: hypoxanthine phosphoribosyltransferase [Candidatus Omnitrophota bacterium]|nr:hypoxanthine phosphoribosyltransferase [Candidatus Omnitrophota bacterium]
MAKPFIRADRIKKRVKALARQISRDYKGKKLVLVGVLKGAFIFLSDLSRALTIPAEIDFVQISSYGASRASSGITRIKKDIDLPLTGKHVLIVEDIVDFGYTMKYLMGSLAAKKPKSIRICALLDKPSRRAVEVPVAYRGFEVPDEFLVGYGLDFNECYRTAPDIRSIGK